MTVNESGHKQLRSALQLLISFVRISDSLSHLQDFSILNGKIHMLHQANALNQSSRVFYQ